MMTETESALRSLEGLAKSVEHLNGALAFGIRDAVARIRRDQFASIVKHDWEKTHEHDWEKTHEDHCMFVCSKCHQAFTGNVISNTPEGWTGKYQSRNPAIEDTK